MAIVQENNYPFSDIGMRLVQVRKKLGLSQNQIAEQLGIHWQTVSRIENGRRKIDAEALVGLCKMGFSATWLLTGRGERFLSDEGNVEQQRLSVEYWQKNHEVLETAVKLAYQRLVDSDGEEKAKEIFAETIGIADLE